jgi:glycosyltransferase involved in cell wall biosynthesis
VTVSESSRQDIVSQYGLDPDKVTVVCEAAAPDFRPAPAATKEEVRRRYGLPERFLIHVGTIEPRKNLTRLVEALHLLREQGLDIPLVVVGQKGWLYAGLFRRLEELGMEDRVHFPGYVVASDLPLLYGAATATAMPSVYEGFGLPILEAMACGTPVVCSNSSSLPELGGQAARYFDPYDAEGMAAAILPVWTQAAMREEMREQGLAQAARFSWERAAEETLALYDRVLASYR